MKKVIRVSQIKLRPDHGKKELDKAVYSVFGKKENVRISYSIHKKSLDARHKPDIYYIYSVDIESIEINGIETGIDKAFSDIKKNKKSKYSANVTLNEIHEYNPMTCSMVRKDIVESERPVIIGFGPAGMFAALKLAQAGLRPVIYERGSLVEERKKKVSNFWKMGELDTECNVQFGEGGAGTFSDGKLNTMIKDPSGRIKNVLETFVRFGADSSILYLAKPHIGTDVLENVVRNIRKHIIAKGGEINFDTKMTDIVQKNGHIVSIITKNMKTGQELERKCSNVCIATGHSARDTFTMLLGKNILMEPKSFAVGLRIEHPQSLINENAYGMTHYNMPAADYKVTYQTGDGRGVYSFCMCPGGYVVNASSEKSMLAVNGMSYSGRDGTNANSAVIVAVTPDDFGHGTLDGMLFQRKLESAAYREGNGNVPVQLFGDFKQKKVSTGYGMVVPQIKGKTSFADLNRVLPGFVSKSIVEGIDQIALKFKGFNLKDAVLSGVESRTSSPLRILRNNELESSVKGLYPCGEGAGYAGGITSAAVDGIKVSEKIIEQFILN